MRRANDAPPKATLKPRCHLHATRSGLDCLVFPVFVAFRRIRVTRVVFCTRSVVARDPSPAITEPAARAKRSASAWSSKYKITCPDIDTSPLGLNPQHQTRQPKLAKSNRRSWRDNKRDAGGTFCD